MRQKKEKRASSRFSFKKSLQYISLNNIRGYQHAVGTLLESVDISNEGMGIRLRGWLPKVGAIVQIRLPVGRFKVTVPVFAQVKWVTRTNHRDCHAGIHFLA